MKFCSLNLVKRMLESKGQQHSTDTVRSISILMSPLDENRTDTLSGFLCGCEPLRESFCIGSLPGPQHFYHLTIR